MERFRSRQGTAPARVVLQRAGDSRSQLTATPTPTPQSSAERGVPGPGAQVPLPAGPNAALPGGVAAAAG